MANTETVKVQRGTIRLTVTPTGAYLWTAVATHGRVYGGHAPTRAYAITDANKALVSAGATCYATPKIFTPGRDDSWISAPHPREEAPAYDGSKCGEWAPVVKAGFLAGPGEVA